MANGYVKLGLLLLVLGESGIVGCRSGAVSHSRRDVSCDLAQRTGFALGPETCCVHGASPALPAGMLIEDEAVLRALWHNAAFQEALADLKIARGDLIQAGLLPNPDLSYFFPVSDKPFKYAVEFPIEALWLRPYREATAAAESARVAQRLSQLGLDLIRDVRQSYADVLLARGRFRVAQEGVNIRGEIARLAKVRLRLGDVSAQEAATAEIDALQSRQESARAQYEVVVAEERLRNLMAVSHDRTPLELDTTKPRRRTAVDAEWLTEQALGSRPDLLAVEGAVSAARERVRLAELAWFRLLGLADATSGRSRGHELGPAFRMTLPLFNRNQGAVSRATAELEKTQRNRLTVRNQVILEVRQAHARYAQARAEHELLTQQVRPAVEVALERAQHAYREGATSYVVVLETTRQVLDSRLREEQLDAELRRAWAELERSVGSYLPTEVLPAHVDEVVPPQAAEALPTTPRE